jgi:hypothetical protein
MNFTDDELGTLYDALVLAIEVVQSDVRTDPHYDDPETLMDAEAYIDSMTALQSRIHAELFPKEQP